VRDPPPVHSGGVVGDTQVRFYPTGEFLSRGTVIAVKLTEGREVSIVSKNLGRTLN
jgi:hypothetical protein